MRSELRVWIIGADHWPRAYLRAELIERGYDAAGYEAIADALVDLAAVPERPPRAIVVDLLGPGLAEPLLEALFRVGAPVVAVAGATAAHEAEVRHHPWAAFLRRPVTVGDIADRVASLTPGS
jgi:hypothetical protein